MAEPRDNLPPNRAVGINKVMTGFRGMSRVGSAALSLVVVLGANACGGSGASKASRSSSSSNDPASELQAAARATANARTVEIVARHGGPATVIDFQAPDRVRSEVTEQTPTGPLRTTVIVIGQTTYQSDPAHRGKFTSFATRNRPSVALFTEPVATSTSVTRDGDTYHFTLGSGAAALEGVATAHLRAGYLDDLTIPFADEGSAPTTQTLTFGKINSGPEVDPPAPSDVEANSPA